MPKYNYLCVECKKEWVEWNSVSNTDMECPYCFSANVNKLPPSFFVIKDTNSKNKKTAKQNVVESIEENREILKKMKDEARKKEYIKDV